VSDIAANLLKLTGSTDKFSRGEKAVAVAAPAQLGYDDWAANRSGRRQMPRLARAMTGKGRTTCVLRQL
jgi:hypothetical protein